MIMRCLSVIMCLSFCPPACLTPPPCRPGNWILERSLDGVTFEPWQFYAISDTECLTQYNTTPRLGSPTYRTDQEVICTSYYSRLVPLEHGEVRLTACLSA